MPACDGFFGAGMRQGFGPVGRDHPPGDRFGRWNRLMHELPLGRAGGARVVAVAPPVTIVTTEGMQGLDGHRRQGR
jgi:hypothetical protein